MANWFQNKLSVSGKLAKDFNEVFKGVPQENFKGQIKPAFCLNSIIPEPDYLDGDTEWRKINWGVSHDVYGTVSLFKPSSRLYIYRFRTAWGTPYMWLLKAARKYPFLNFSLEYVEPYNNIGGEYNFSCGTLIGEKYDNCCEVKRRYNQSFKETG